MKFIVAQLGARLHYAVPRVFHQAGLLKRLYTDLFIQPGSLSCRLIDSLLSVRLAGKLKRNNPGLPPELVRSNNLHGWMSKIRLQIAKSPLVQVQAYEQASQWLAQMVIADSPSADLIYGFDTASLELFRWAKPRGTKLVLEQCVAPRQTQLSTLGALSKSAQQTVSGPQIEAWRRLALREETEWALADVILCPSDYVLHELKKAGAPPAKLKWVPYGVKPPPQDLVESALNLRAARSRDKLRVLFVGEVGLRKGMLEVIAAAQKLNRNHYEFIAAGRMALPERYLSSFNDNVQYLGNLSPDELAREYGRADCMILPSHLEGSATVVYEALAWGLPVVTTYSTGTVVENGLSGFVGQAGDVDFLITSLERLRSESGLLTTMTENARKRSQSFTTDAYQRRLIEATTAIA